MVNIVTLTMVVMLQAWTFAHTRVHAEKQPSDWAQIDNKTIYIYSLIAIEQGGMVLK